MIKLHIMFTVLSMMVCIPWCIDAILDPLFARVLLMLMAIGHSSMGGHWSNSGQNGQGTEYHWPKRHIFGHFKLTADYAMFVYV